MSEQSFSDKHIPQVAGVSPAKRQRPWGSYILVSIVIAAVIFGSLFLTINDGSPVAVDQPEELNYAEVIITDLVQEETFNGTLGSIEADPVKVQLDGTITDIPSLGDVINQGAALFAIDDQPVVMLCGELPAFRDMIIGEATLTVSSLLIGTITSIAEIGAVIEQGDVLYRVDDHPVVVLYGDQPAYRTIRFSPGWTVSEAGLTAAQSNSTIAADQLEQAEAAYAPYRNKRDNNLNKAYYGGAWAAAQQVYDTAVRQQNALLASTASAIITGYDVRQLQEALITLGYDPDGRVSADGVFDFSTRQMVIRWQQDIGIEEADGIIDSDEIVFLPGPAQVLDVLAALGDQAGGSMVSVSTGDPMSGIDIQQLEAALASLGYDAEGTLIVDGVYSPETTQAVLAFQAATGLEQDGILNLGEIIFLPGSVQVTSQLTTKGSWVGVGSVIMGISLSEQVVQFGLPAKNQALLAVGDAVIIELPDNTEVPAAILSVSQVGTQLDNGQVVFEILIALDDPTVAAGLDEAPVDVIIIIDSVEDVMAIPVSALVALLEGGYAVEVDAGNDTTQYIAVEVGFFSSNNLIEITSGELQPGDQVILP